MGEADKEKPRLPDTGSLIRLNRNVPIQNGYLRSFQMAIFFDGPLDKEVRI